MSVRSQRILAWLLPSAHAEALLGDLLEECRLRLQAGSPRTVARWYWGQLVSSIPVLLWASIRRSFSFITLLIAVASYLGAGGVALVLRTALSPMTTSKVSGGVVVLLCGVTAMAAAGYIAALIRPGAARLLAVLVLVATSAMTATSSGSLPLWYEGSFLVLSPLAAIAGAALSGGGKRRRT